MEQIEYWNGPAGERWVREQDAIDAGMRVTTDKLFAYAAPRAGERVLDVGCGCGTTSLRLASLGCDVTGIDVSAPMLAVARKRGVRVIEGDAAKAPGSYDLVFSRFGVMFFNDPAVAFAHLRSISRRIAFVCWRAFEDNLWGSEPIRVARDLLPPQPALDPNAPGPFSLASKDRILELLPGAEIEAPSSVMGIGSTLEESVTMALTLGPLARAAADVDEPTRERILDRLRELYAPYLTPEGVRLPAAIWLVRA